MNLNKILIRFSINERFEDALLNFETIKNIILINYAKK